MTSHDEYEGLAAGYALHALEPEDEQLLAAHLLTCQSCARLVANSAAVATALAEGLPLETPSPGLRDAILQAAAAEPRGSGAEPEAGASGRVPSPALTPLPRQGAGGLRQRRQTRIRVAVGALAAAVAVAIAVPVTLAVSGSGEGTGGQTPLAQALLQPGAQEVSLTGSSAAAKTVVAKAVMGEDGMFFLADGLPANDTSRAVYVLWAANKAGELKPIATFDAHSGKPVQVSVRELPFPASAISSVSVSHEPGRQAPAKPSDVVLSSKSA